MFRGIERIMFVVMLFTVLVSAFMVSRLRQVDPDLLVPRVNLREAAKNYQQRMHATQMMLHHDRF